MQISNEKIIRILREAKAQVSARKWYTQVRYLSFYLLHLAQVV